MQSFIRAFRELSFKGRVSVDDYWKFLGIIISIYAVIFFVPIFWGLAFDVDTNKIIYLLIIIFSIVVFLPSWTMQVKRLHDINKSGNWLFLYLIPFVGWIILFVLLCKNGDKETNNYGTSSTIRKTTVPTKNNIFINDSAVEPENIPENHYVNKKKYILPILLSISICANIYFVVSNMYILNLNKKLESEINRKNVEFQDSQTKIRDLEEDLDFYENNAVIVTENGEKYHKYNCQYIQGKSYYIYNVEAAQAYGYSPCEVCFKEQDDTESMIEWQLEYIKDKASQTEPLK